MEETRKQRKEDKKMLKSLDDRTRKEKKEDKKNNTYKTTQKLKKAKKKLEEAEESGKKGKIKRKTKKLEKAQGDVDVRDAANASRLVERTSKNIMASTLRTESPLAKYKCGYNSKKSSLRKSEENVTKKELKKRIVIEDRGRGLGGITQDTTTNKFYSQTYPNVEMDSTHKHNPFDRSLVTVNWSKKEK